MANKTVPLGDNGAQLMSMKVWRSEGGYVGVEIQEGGECPNAAILTPGEFRDLMRRGNELLDILEGDC